MQGENQGDTINFAYQQRQILLVRINRKGRTQRIIAGFSLLSFKQQLLSSSLLLQSFSSLLDHCNSCNSVTVVFLYLFVPKASPSILLGICPDISSFSLCTTSSRVCTQTTLMVSIIINYTTIIHQRLLLRDDNLHTRFYIFLFHLIRSINILVTYTQ